MIGVDYQLVFQRVPGLFLVLRPDANFTIEAASDAYLRATLTRRDQIVGRALFDVFPGDPDDDRGRTIQNLRESLLRVIATGLADALPVQRYDLSVPGQDGELVERYWSPVNSPVLGPEGNVAYLIHRVEDVTELHRITRREQDERAKLVEANNRFQAVYDQGLFAGRLDLQGTVIDANRSSLEACGLVREDVLGKPFWECGWWNRSPAVQSWVRRAVDQAIRGEPFRGESPYFWADGSEHVVDFACMPIKDAAGNVMFVVPTGMDITARVNAEKDLRASEILESITEGFFALDREWRFTYLNGEAQRILGRTAAELVGLSLWTAYPGLEGHELQKIYVRTMMDREANSLSAYYPDHDRWYEVHVYPAPEGIAVYFRNVTTQKRAEAERDRIIAASETQRHIYEAALSNTPDFVYIFDRDHRVTYANEALLTMWGVTRETAVGKRLLDLGYEPWHADMHHREIDQVIATRRPIRGEVPFTGTHGRRIYDYIFAPVVGPDGEIVAVAGTTRDVTDRQQAEQSIREQAQRLQESDRAKDEFLATLSHELRNPLAPLRNSLYLLRSTGRADSVAAPVLEMMERQVNHLVRLVDDLLELSRISRGTFELRKERVEVAAVVRNAIETSDPLIQSAGHRLTVRLPDEPLWVEGDPVRLAQVLANLLNNAAKYTDDGGSIEVEARSEGSHATIAVRDNGAGIAAEALPRMFEMFSRGDRVSGRAQGGLGIGLALSRRLAQMHGGTLDAKSAGPGQGSEFTVRLPLADVQSRATAVTNPVASALPRKRILVVDDNRDAAESLSMILMHLGADVRVAQDGHEALRTFEDYDPSVVLLDIGMPGMDGYEVARTIRDRFPNRRTAIVALTGWGQDSDRQAAQDAGFDHHLVKPAEIGALQVLLRSLDRRTLASGGS